MVYGETGRFPIDLDAQCNAIKYYVRLRKMNDNMLAKQVFNQLHCLHETGFKTWVSYVLNLLKQQNINVVHESLDTLLSTYKMKAYDSYKNEWQNSMNEISFPILRTYQNIKSNYTLEPYLHINNFKFRNALSRLRMSSHCLEIERGRHTNPKTNQELRKCNHCKQDVIEDEFHLMMQCTFYCESRKHLFELIGKVCIILFCQKSLSLT